MNHSIDYELLLVLVSRDPSLPYLVAPSSSLSHIILFRPRLFSYGIYWYTLSHVSFTHYFWMRQVKGCNVWKFQKNLLPFFFPHFKLL
jgi:uncharacterized membrane protein YhhN